MVAKSDQDDDRRRHTFLIFAFLTFFCNLTRPKWRAASSLAKYLMVKNGRVRANEKKYLRMRSVLAKFVRQYGAGKLATNPWWYLLIEDETMSVKWDSLSRLVFMMSEIDTLILMETCGLLSIKRDKKGSVLGIRAFKTDAITDFILEHKLSDVMSWSHTKVKGDKKARYFICLGGSDGGKKSVTQQSRLTRGRAPRVCQPALREYLLHEYVACRFTGYNSQSMEKHCVGGTLRQEASVLTSNAKTGTQVQVATNHNETNLQLEARIEELEKELNAVKAENEQYRKMVEVRL